MPNSDKDNTQPSAAFISGSTAVSLSGDVEKAQQAVLRMDVDRSSGKRPASVLPGLSFFTP
jgi:hypothetical protein